MLKMTLDGSVLALTLLASPLIAQDTGFVSRTVDVEGVSYAYQVFVPSQWTADERWPVSCS